MAYASRMDFVFDIDKAIASAAYITKRCDENLTIFVLLKMMYAAERDALANWQRPIAGDSFASLPKGPILSRTYDLIKSGVANTNSDMVKWSKYFSPRCGRGNNQIKLIAEPDLSVLSQLENESLERAISEVAALIKQHGLIAEELHKKWPEWQDPSKYGRGAIPLSLHEVLSEVIDDESEIERIILEIRAVASAKSALQVAA
jgi:Protein of unknown function (DUF4065)